MKSRYLARTATGVPLLGDDEGFIPLTAAAPDLQSGTDALACGYEYRPNPADATSSHIPADHLEFGMPLEEPGILLGIGLNYADHAAADLDEERPDEPASFVKSVTTITGPRDRPTSTG